MRQSVRTQIDRHLSVRILPYLHAGAHKVRPQTALGQLKSPPDPGHRVVVADHAFLDHAQDVAPRPFAVGDERRALLLRANRKLPVVFTLVVILQPNVRSLDRPDTGQAQLLRQPVPRLRGGRLCSVRKARSERPLASGE